MRWYKLGGRESLWLTLGFCGLLANCGIASENISQLRAVNAAGSASESIAALPSNPFEGAEFYLSPEYKDNISQSQAAAGEPLKAAMEKLKAYPTAIWIDSIGMIEGSRTRLGITAHLDHALKQQQAQSQNGKPVLITFVVYNLPDRDCAAFASNGELKGSENGLERYRTEYIDQIVAKFTAKPEYKQLRIVTIVEPDSLPNLVTNQSIPACVAAAEGYKAGVQYAVARLTEIENVSVYLDTAHSGWLGWPQNLSKAAQTYQEVLGSNGLLGKIRGFATNVSNYTPTKEAFDPFRDPNQHSRIIQEFYQWNPIIDETSFVNALSAYFPDKGFIIDTGRNGWAPSNELQPRDRRSDRGNWCNIMNAGIGERPQVNPAPHTDAYFWIKPPGESDGTSDVNAGSGSKGGKRFDKMCGIPPVQRNGRDIPTDALQGAPHAGEWFDAGFQMLVKNANPAL